MTHIDFSRCRIAVIGDLILDKYIDGSVGRLSPEAPVAVLLHQSEHVVPGGAANVVANIAALGGAVKIFGVIGDDQSGHELTNALGRLPTVDVGGIIADATRPTTCKTRVMSARHQIVRIDFESNLALPPECESKLIDAFERALDWADVVIVSDYAKGVCGDLLVRRVLELSASHDKPTIVDPKRRDLEAYRGARFITPNRRELAEATGLACESDEDAERAARAAIERTQASILLTRSERGMSLFSDGAQPLHLPTAAREVFDVSGAGDTVVALFGLGVAAKLTMAEAMRIANLGAGIVVGKVGTALVASDELEAALTAEAHHDPQRRGALISRAEAARLRREWGRAGLRVGFTNGCFDLLHPGHVSLLRQAAAACDRLIVGLNGDASVRRLKGAGRPVQDERSRAIVLGAMEAIDLVVIFEEDTPAELIAELRPDVLVKGADYQLPDVVGADIVEANGGRVLLAELTPGQSTTAMIDRSRGDQSV